MRKHSLDSKTQICLKFKKKKEKNIPNNSQKRAGGAILIQSNIDFQEKIIVIDRTYYNDKRVDPLRKHN